MYRSNTCGELRLSDAGKEVTLAGWVQRSRKMGGMTFVDLRDRYGITQLVFNEADNKDLCDAANKLGREFCIQIKGVVSERQSKNPKMDTGDIEILVKELNVLSQSQTPPFTIEDNTDGGDDIRIQVIDLLLHQILFILQGIDLAVDVIQLILMIFNAVLQITHGRCCLHRLRGRFPDRAGGCQRHRCQKKIT